MANQVQWTDDDAREAAGLLTNNTPATLPEYGALADMLTTYMDEKEAAKQAELDARPTAEKVGDFIGNRIIKGGLENVGGAIDVGTTILTGALGEIPAGGLGAVTLAAAPLFGVKDNVGLAVKVVEGVRDAFTWTPKTEVGQKILGTVAAPLEQLDSYADGIAEWAATNSKTGEINPYVATGVYTLLTGGAEIGGIHGGRVLSGLGKINQRLKKAKDIAKDLNINLTQKDLPKDIVTAAKNMTNDERAFNAPALTKAIDEARLQNKAQVATDTAAVGKVSTNATPVAEFGHAIEVKLLDEGFDVTEFPTLQNRLDDLQNIETTNIKTGFEHTGPNSSRTATLEEMTLLDGRLERNIATATQKADVNLPVGQQEGAALRRMQRELHEFVDGQFMDDMISGDPNAAAAWTKAVNTRKAYSDRFSADKAIVGLLQRSASPLDVHKFLLGSSALASKSNAGIVVKRLKEVLGDRHPAIQGIKSDFLFELFEPLIKADGPDFGRFRGLYDRSYRRNPILFKELGLDQGDVDIIYKLSQTADKLPPAEYVGRWNKIKDQIAIAGSRLGFGHGMSKAQLRVGYARSAFNLLLGKDRIGQRKVWHDAADAMLDVPIVPWQSVAAGKFISRAFLADIGDANEDVEREKSRR